MLVTNRPIQFRPVQRPVIPNMQKNAISGMPVSSGADRVTFGNSQAAKADVPSLPQVKQTVRDFIQSIRSSFLRNTTIRPDSLELVPTPIHSGVLEYNYYTGQGAQRSTGVVTHLMSGEDADGQKQAVCSISFRKNPETNQWQFASLQSPRKEMFTALSDAIERFPDAELHFFEGLPGTATIGLQALMVKDGSGDNAQTQQVYVLTTANSFFPNPERAASEPMKAGDVLSQSEFEQKITRLGRMDEERTLLRALLELDRISTRQGRQLMNEMVGEDKADTLMDGASDTQRLPYPQREATLKELIKTQLADTPIKVGPYLNRATMPGDDN